MLNLLGTIAGNILSLPGILGLALGLTTRNIFLAAAMGGLVGLAETLLFAGFDMSQIEFLDLFIAIGVGLLAGSVGCAIRIKGTTV
ncbi:hypothetical protein [Primorskyibacter sp. S87]|uniref:hypothetical protein n=1 Tax=Primorskyibacter sp. S87 TaxID=3415126 RepID=UPI003C7D4B8B